MQPPLFAPKVSGATLGSSSICFEPTCRPIAGTYRFDVAEAREGGSAGAASLVVQTVAMPAVFAKGASQFRILGGTHNDWSPTFDYVSEVWIPFLHRIGIRMQAKIETFGFFPVQQMPRDSSHPPSKGFATG